MWKSLRVMLLLVVLGVVALTTWLDREQSVSWSRPLWVGVFPIAGDNSSATSATIAKLTEAQFTPIADFLAAQGRAQGLAIAQPVRMLLYPALAAAPPSRPQDSGAVGNLWWSLWLRYWAWARTRELLDTPPHVRLYVIYHDPGRTVKVAHSVGLKKGLIGVVHVFADPAAAAGNQIVITHELLHTLGATDKYDARNLPLFPDGYADPQQSPRYPQRRAEIMAGRRALSATSAEMPASLAQVTVGPLTAREIRWRP